MIEDDAESDDFDAKERGELICFRRPALSFEAALKGMNPNCAIMLKLLDLQGTPPPFSKVNQK